MQLGTRWSFGDEPPAKIGEAMAHAVAEIESELVEYDTAGWRWTLTWLEGRPVVELDDGTVLRMGADGAIVVTESAD